MAACGVHPRAEVNSWLWVCTSLCLDVCELKSELMPVISYCSREIDGEHGSLSSTEAGFPVLATIR